MAHIEQNVCYEVRVGKNLFFGGKKDVASRKFIGGERAIKADMAALFSNLCCSI
jgi:hypothetical protein